MESLNYGEFRGKIGLIPNHHSFDSIINFEAHFSSRYFCCSREDVAVDMDNIFPPTSSPVSLPAIDVDAIEDMSIGEVGYAATLLLREFAQRLANPAAVNELALFTQGNGTDWSGLTSITPPQFIDPNAEDAQEDDEDEEKPAKQLIPPPGPASPTNYHDSLPGLAAMLQLQQRASDASLTYLARFVEMSLKDQTTYLGAPIGVKAYRDGPTYFREVMKFSRQQTKKIHERLPYLTWTPGQDPELLSSQPKLTLLAKSFADGKLSAENADRIVEMDKDLTKYTHKVGQTTAYKDDVLKAFESTLVEAGESATPDELSQSKRRWTNRIAHAICPDGPPVAEALRKQADNALHTKSEPDGSGRIWMHATSEVYSGFKNFCLHQMKLNGTPAHIPEELLVFFENDAEPAESSDETENPPAVSPAAAFNDLDDAQVDQDPAATVAKDPDGNPYSAAYLEKVDQLSFGQRLGAILIGMFQNILKIDPKVIGAKTAHGVSARLTIVQDIQTAYETLGVGALPEAVRRPPGAAGIVPAVIKRPNPDDPAASPCLEPNPLNGYTSQPNWTEYRSEAINIGPMHPKDTALLCCDSEVSAAIWSGEHMILNHGRTKRLFTADQRLAVLSRDRGCQAPGCTVPAVYCDLHHIFPWLLGGLTNIDNATTLCAIHHAAVHNGKWTIRKQDGIIFFQPAPWLDPAQPLLRNIYWSL